MSENEVILKEISSDVLFSPATDMSRFKQDYPDGKLPNFLRVMLGDLDQRKINKLIAEGTAEDLKNRIEAHIRLQNVSYNDTVDAMIVKLKKNLQDFFETVVTHSGNSRLQNIHKATDNYQAFIREVKNKGYDSEIEQELLKEAKEIHDGCIKDIKDCKISHSELVRSIDNRF